MNLRSRLSLNFIFLFICLLMVFHFVMTMAYLTPPSPAKLRVWPYATAYMEPFFNQDWHLFAPDPVKDTQVIVVNCKIEQPNGTMAETGWSDISTPFREATYRNRFSSADYISKIQSGVAHSVLNPNGELFHLFDNSRTEEDSDYNKIVDEMEEAGRESAKTIVQYLNRVASAHCDRLYGMGRTKEVQPRIVVLDFPRFSERFKSDSEGELSFFDLEWAPYEQVAPIQTRGI